jgi:hypothetical protein
VPRTQRSAISAFTRVSDALWPFAERRAGGVSVSGSIGEAPQGAPNKSISAGFKRSW